MIVLHYVNPLKLLCHKCQNYCVNLHTKLMQYHSQFVLFHYHALFREKESCKLHSCVISVCYKLWIQLCLKGKKVAGFLLHFGTDDLFSPFSTVERKL